MYYQSQENNPHFLKPPQSQPQYEDHRLQPPSSSLYEDHLPPSTSPLRPSLPQGHRRQPRTPVDNVRPDRDDRPYYPPNRPRVKIQEPTNKPRPASTPSPTPVQQQQQHEQLGQPADRLPRREQPADRLPRRDQPADRVPRRDQPADRVPRRDQPADRVPRDQPADRVPRDQPADRIPRSDQPADWLPRREQRHHQHLQNLRLPTPQKTKAYTWFAAVFCVIFWLVIIVGGLIVLIIYLIFRPQNPRMYLPHATLNAAYLDMGYLLNADISLLANITNPNKKVNVDFSSITLDLYFGETMIASQYVEPFSIGKAQSRFENVRMVSSLVQLPYTESQRLKKEMESNGVLFQVKGTFRTRSKLGSILRYSYWLYATCNFMVTRPPDGVLIASKCSTKR